MTHSIAGNNSTSPLGLRTASPPRWTATDAPPTAEVNFATTRATNRVAHTALPALGLDEGAGPNRELAVHVGQALGDMDRACGCMSEALPRGASACANPAAWDCTGAVLQAAGLQPRG